MKYYILIVTIYIIAILNVNEQHLARVAVCGGIYFIAEIGYVLKQILEQRKEEAEKNRRLLEAIALDLVSILHKKDK